MFRSGLGLLKGMYVTLKHLLATYFVDQTGRSESHRRPAAWWGQHHGMFTVQYPEERAVPMPRSRGALMMKRHPVTGEPNCVGCYRCAMACPIGCIQVLTTQRPDGTRRIDAYTVKMEKCMFCTLCVDACDFDALEVSTEYELGAYSRGPQAMLYDMERLLAIGDRHYHLRKDR